MFLTTKPSDTSRGVFNTLRDVGEQDAAVAANWPVLKNQFDLIVSTEKRNQETDIANRKDYIESIDAIRTILDGVIKDGAEESKWNPFD